MVMAGTVMVLPFVMLVGLVPPAEILSLTHISALSHLGDATLSSFSDGAPPSGPAPVVAAPPQYPPPGFRRRE